MFQLFVKQWLLDCFGPAIAYDKSERNFRFLEESLELVQSIGMTEEEVQQTVKYVYGRDRGKPGQEVGGVLVCLAALCMANGIKMDEEGWDELKRISDQAVMDRIRSKQASKPKQVKGEA